MFFEITLERFYSLCKTVDVITISGKVLTTKPKYSITRDHIERVQVINLQEKTVQSCNWLSGLCIT